MHGLIESALQNAELARALHNVRGKFVFARAAATQDYNSAAANAAAFEELREYGKQRRAAAVANMPQLLAEFERNAQAAGARVLWAKDAAGARELIVAIAKKHNVEMAVKSKSMASEEAQLNDALAKAGVEPVETDLGEFIIQLAGEAPAHIIAPAMHKSRLATRDLFAKNGIAAKGESIADLTRAAREHLREKFFAAGMGITGANFLAADTGSAVMVTNEGNGRMSATLPPVHVTLAGIDKILPSFDDLPAMLALLTRSATGQHLSNYVSVTTGARRAGAGGAEGGGAANAYIVLMDNGRSAARAGDYAEMLRCIRCGACMNHCPVYGVIGGHAYGSVYMGPMGQTLTPALLGVENTPDMPYAATMCNACAVVCPVKIPLPNLMRKLREERVRKKHTASTDRFLMGVWHFFAMRPRLYAAATAAAARLLRLLAGKGGGIKRLPGLSGWFGGRDLPPPAGETFRAIMRKRQQGEAGRK